MGIDNNFINKLPENVLMAEQKIVETFYKTMEVYGMSDDKSVFYEDFIELYSFYQVYAEKHSIDVAFPKLGTNPKNNFELIISFFSNRNRIVSKKVEKYASEQIFDEKKNKFKAILYDDYLYTFESEELKSIRMILYQMKNYLAESQHLEGLYIQRLSKRLEHISKEMRIEVPSLDMLWGLIGEAGVIVGKAGDKCNNIVNKIRELIHIVWKVQARTEKLSSEDIPLKFLTFKEAEKPKDSRLLR